MKAVDMVARLEEIAHRVDAAGVEVVSLSIDHNDRVDVHCSSADDVDAVMELLDDAPAPYELATLHSRWATFDEVLTVLVYGPARANACSCGHACDHTTQAAEVADAVRGLGPRWAEESRAVEAMYARQDARYGRHDRTVEARS